MNTIYTLENYIIYGSELKTSSNVRDFLPIFNDKLFSKFYLMEKNTLLKDYNILMQKKESKVLKDLNFINAVIISVDYYEIILIVHLNKASASQSML